MQTVHMGVCSYIFVYMLCNVMHNIKRKNEYVLILDNLYSYTLAINLSLTIVYQFHFWYPIYNSL